MAAGIRSMGFLVKQIVLLLQQLMDGYRFSPTEEELIDYLKLEEPGCREGFCIIPTIANIYEINPSDLQAKFSKESIIPSNDREWWFICPQMQNQRISRKTPCGSSWKITGARKDVVIDGKKIGSKTTLVFPDGRGSKGGKSDWVIHEYRLPTEDKLVQARMNALMEPRQHQNQIQFSLPDVLHLFKWGLRSQSNRFPSNIHQCLFSEVQKGEEPRLEKDQQETAARNIEPSISLDETAAREKHLIQAKMKSPVEPSQHQNQFQFSLPDLPQLRSQNNSVPSTIHQFANIGSPSVDDFSSDNALESFLKGAEARLEKVQQETAARNIEPCMSLDETAARAKNGQISITENRQSKIEPFDGVFPLEETGGVAQSTFNSSHFSGQGCEEHNLAGNSPKMRRLNMPEKNQIQ
ncbi:NAC domain-containing protein 40-like isoform X4 [Syzygium oleosum]|uniref:NAC domain-containing protein 40-like isoform X4 n=1 Tax=Syzygium oleosum TaxID=219896 RepID=UPI0024BB2447|nr:NAC domain-containing protein 40-like isoform X4 [Syzygium oleosum]